ncbi:MAG TPA: 4-(cytidine 5'-diphospho)-2-C-methyl-D-erythritol kinase [Dehalococcoidia bacterium]|nr:4-(cytidine 5'-diphospho)-2-C-methyl-D-erythritol kinase [Dehalococcoidia bacterium]
MLTIEAPAKLNLTLEVLGKRPDGYHEIRSVVQTIDLCDRLHFQAGNRTEYKSSMLEWVAEDSLVSKAVTLLKDATGCTSGVSIEVEKHIPLLSGLGGDSSDAAAVLVGLNRLWELDLSQERLLGLAAELGSDVALFLHGGTALIEGRGEVVTPLLPLSGAWFVLVLPGVPRQPGKTGRAYAGLKESDYTGGQYTGAMVEILKGGGRLEPSILFNVFERTVFEGSQAIAECRQQVINAGAGNIHLAGSGPALFTLARDKETAKRLYERLSQQGMETYLVKTTND